MFKKFRIPTAPFAFCATSFVLVIAMLLPGFSLPSRSEATVEAAPLISDAGPEDVFSTESYGAETDDDALSAADGHTPARVVTYGVIEESAPPSIASKLTDLDPQLSHEIREASIDIPDVDNSLPVHDFVMYNLSDEEFRMLCWCVEGEAHGKSLRHREIIAQVVMNRVFNERFPNTVKDVLFSHRQFSVMSWYTPGYYDKFVTPLSEEAVRAVMNGEVEDYSMGALYFCNPNIAHNVEWFDNCLVTLFEFENHRFYTAP